MKSKSIAGTPDTEYSMEFLQGMVNRMIVYFHKYGKVSDAYPAKVDALASLQKRLDKYAEDGNLEWLMDVANFAMIEFMRPRHKLAHFRATDSHESPGRKFHKQKTFTQAANTDNKNTEVAALTCPTYRREGD